MHALGRIDGRPIAPGARLGEASTGLPDGKDPLLPFAAQEVNLLYMALLKTPCLLVPGNKVGQQGSIAFGSEKLLIEDALLVPEICADCLSFAASKRSLLPMQMQCVAPDPHTYASR